MYVSYTRLGLGYLNRMCKVTSASSHFLQQYSNTSCLTFTGCDELPVVLGAYMLLLYLNPELLQNIAQLG